jgi:GT2 family glycosyltransferase
MELAYQADQPGGLIPLRPGARYRLAGLLAVHRCDAALVVRVLGADGEPLEEVAAPASRDARGGTDPALYDQVALAFEAPDAPCAAQLLLRKGPTLSGRDSWLFFARPWFGRVRDRTAAPRFAPPAFAAPALAALQRLEPGGVQVLRVPLPAPAAGAPPLAVEVVERATGRPLEGSPLQVRRGLNLAGAITGIDGTTVAGWARNLEHPETPLELGLLVDGREAGTALAELPHGGGTGGFRLPLPSWALDGQAHRISVCRVPGRQLVDETAALLPAQLTPWPALARHGGTRLPAVLSTAAAWRYEALRAHLAALARPAADAEAEAARRLVLPQLAAAHERLLLGLDRTPATLAPLAFPRFAAPKVSVVIPVHDKLAVTHNCLAALLLAWNDASFEVVVADDGSTDGTAELEALVSGITVVRNARAEGFVSACNLGVAAARGEYVVLLNNDTEPTARWLDELLHAFANFERVGMAGSKLLYPDGRLQEAGGIVWGNGQPWNYGRNANPADPRYSYTRQSDYLSGAALMLPRALWDAVGGLSEEFRPAYYEDTDLAFKVREAGYRTLYVATSVVFHFEGVSNGTSTSSGLKRFQEVNRPKFLRKWRAAYRGHGTDTRRVDLEKDRGAAFRALFLDVQTPRPDHDAGSHAAVQEMRAMQALGAKVTFLPENLAWLGAYATDLQRAGIEVVHAPFARSVEDFLKARGAEFEIVYITRYMVAQRHLEAVRRHAPQAKVMFCNADLHFLRELREAIAAGSEEKLQAAVATRDAELRVMREVDVTLSYNPVEHAVILSHNLNSTKVAACPWIVDVAGEVPGFSARSDIAFLGGFGHPPNAEAVRFFAREVMPLLRRRLPGARFLVYGSGMPPELAAEIAAEDVVAKGFVADLADVFATCRVFVAPLLSGAGVKGKVADALSFGVPSVLSPVAAEGIGLGEGSEALVARGPDEWAEAVAALYADPARWAEVSARALGFARRHFSLERGVELMRAALEAAGAEGVEPSADRGLVARRARLGL